MAEVRGRLGGLAPLGAVLHLGAGRGSDVPGYLAAGAKQILLAEPEPGCQQALAALARRHRRVQVAAVAAVPDGTQESGRLRRFSFSSLNSLRQPSERLAGLFPGLQMLEPTRVALQSVAELAARLDFTVPGTHVLAIEAPGMALELLEALTAAGILEKFRLIRVQEGQAPLFKGAAAMDGVEAYLVQAGFDRNVKITRRDPAWPVLAAEAGESLTAQVPLRQYRVLQEQLKQLETRVQAREADCAQLASARDAAVAEAQELRRRCSGLEARVVELEQRNAAGRDGLRQAEAQMELLRDLLLAAEDEA